MSTLAPHHTEVDRHYHQQVDIIIRELERNGYSVVVPEKSRSRTHEPDIRVLPSKHNEWFAEGETGIEILSAVLKMAYIRRPVLEAAEMDRDCAFVVPDGRETHVPHDDHENQEKYQYVTYHAKRVVEALDKEDLDPTEVPIIILGQNSDESGATLYSYEDGRATELE